MGYMTGAENVGEFSGAAVTADPERRADLQLASFILLVESKTRWCDGPDRSSPSATNDSEQPMLPGV